LLLEKLKFLDKKMIRLIFIIFLLFNYLKAWGIEKEIKIASDYIDKGDFSKAVEIITPLVEKEDPYALNMMGWLYMNGKGVEKNEKKALELYMLSASKGFAKAYYNLGLSYEYGKGTDVDIAKAIYHYKEGYSRGDPKSAFALGKLYTKGCKTEKNFDDGIKYLKYSCRKKISDSCYFLGNIYETEYRDEKKAEKYYIKAGELGYVEGFRRAGNIFFYKKPIKSENIKKAVKYYNLALEKKDPVSAYNLGTIYLSGIEPFEKDEIKAYELFNISASSGYAPAFGRLGVLYATSQKSGIDLNRAKDYLMKGVKSNDPYSIIMANQFCKNKIILCSEEEKSMLEEKYFKNLNNSTIKE